MYRGLYAYAWDFIDEGLTTALDRIRSTGINTITLAASYHAGKFLRPDPPIVFDAMIEWTADWVARGMPSLSRPTHFEVRSGRF